MVLTLEFIKTLWLTTLNFTKKNIQTNWHEELENKKHVYYLHKFGIF